MIIKYSNCQTSEEARNEFLEKENKIIEDIEKEQRKENVKKKVLSIFKRI